MPIDGDRYILLLRDALNMRKEKVLHQLEETKRQQLLPIIRLNDF